MNRQIGVKNFIQVVILDPPIKGHVIQCMRIAQPQNCHGPLCTAERATYNIAIIFETETDQHEISGQYLDNENVSGDAVL